MKKSLYILTLICFIMNVFTSCTLNDLVFPEEMTQNTEEYNPNVYKNPIHNTQFEQDALYQYFNLNGILSKFNVTTGDMTFLCDDPICSHERGSQCLFAGIHLNFCIDNEKNMIYYIQDMPSGDGQRLIKYDIASKKATVLYSIPHTSVSDTTGISCQTNSRIAYGYYWNREVYTNTFYRVNIETGKRENLNVEYTIPDALIDGRYYCISDTSPCTEVYSLDQSMRDKQVIIEDCIVYNVSFDNVRSEIDGFITFYEWTSGVLTCYSFDMGTRRKTEYIAPSGNELVFSYGHYRCGLKAQEHGRYMGECGLNGAIYNRSNGIVYRRDDITGKEEILFSNDDLVLEFPEVVGKYIVYNFGAFVVNDTFMCPYWNNTAGGKLAIDIETGNYHVYYNTWDKTLHHYHTSPQYQK